MVSLHRSEEEIVKLKREDELEFKNHLHNFNTCVASLKDLSNTFKSKEEVISHSFCILPLKLKGWPCYEKVEACSKTVTGLE